MINLRAAAASLLGSLMKGLGAGADKILRSPASISGGRKDNGRGVDGREGGGGIETRGGPAGPDAGDLGDGSGSDGEAELGRDRDGTGMGLLGGIFLHASLWGTIPLDVYDNPQSVQKMKLESEFAASSSWGPGALNCPSVCNSFRQWVPRDASVPKELRHTVQNMRGEGGAWGEVGIGEDGRVGGLKRGRKSQARRWGRREAVG
jgi:hypothetical protein